MPGGLEDLESEGRERRVRGSGKPLDCAVPGHHAVHRRGVERQILRRAPHGKPIPGNQARNTPDVVEMRMGQKNPRGLEAGLLNGGGNLLRAIARVKDQRLLRRIVPDKVAVLGHRRNGYAKKSLHFTWVDCTSRRFSISPTTTGIPIPWEHRELSPRGHSRWKQGD